MKLKICEILGVEPDQQFRFNEHTWRIHVHDDGRYVLEGLADDGISWIDRCAAELLMKMIEQSGTISKAWTYKDFEDAMAIQQLYPDGVIIGREREGHGRKLRIFDAQNCFIGEISKAGKVLPSLKIGEEAELAKIAEV